jgi:hypothetical protein
MSKILDEYHIIRNKINRIDSKIIKLKELTKLEMKKIKNEEDKKIILEKFKNNLKLIKNKQYNSLVEKLNYLKKILITNKNNNNSNPETLSDIDGELKSLKKKYT